MLSYPLLARPFKPLQPRILEKPTKFNPPSHGKRLKQQIPRHYGPQLTGEQRNEQQTKKYPNMMPAPGTFMHWFLTSRGIHTFISLGILVLLASITAFENWRLATAFREQLPTAGDFLSQPLTAFWQAVEVFKLETAKTSAETAEKRRRSVEDVQKRNAYRIAHGLQDENSEGLGGWTARSDVETLGSGAKADGAVGRPVGVEPGQEVEPEGVGKGGDGREGPVNDREGRKKHVKKWLGIW
ncbi:hypothetical protein HO133_004747 [Letharia lupina]|uniref:Uncharacterized protein n=1 Tax=Letharia lupina TaxID=560253 RepID=A0A8H6FKW9_9LECA|nr:uncharacterized protein HO133_004747 [Letharia lupina]KAF6230405.1 hypothetical protein HO133_004747 [Letharia lupina]